MYLILPINHVTDCSISTIAKMNAPSSIQQHLSRPLNPLQSEYKGRTISVADLPAAWIIHLQGLQPRRLSFNPTMISDLAQNFRLFFGNIDLPADQDLERTLKYCTGPWEASTRDILVGPPGLTLEANITALHANTIKLAIPQLFRFLLQNRPSCFDLRDLGLRAHSFINDEESGSGKVDSCFSLQLPVGGGEEENIRCCWFDDKNPGVLDGLNDELEERIQGGVNLIWGQGNPMAMRLLVKVSISLL
jgi:hypothetical protein